MKLYITGIPEPAGLNVVRALRSAHAHLAGVDSGMTYEDANRVLAIIRSMTAPYLFGETDDHEAVKAARLALTEANVTCAQDLPDEALVPPPVEPARSVSYPACRYALVAMRLADGNPHMALHHCVLLAHQINESEGEPGVFREAAAVLLDVFPASIVDDASRIIARSIGIDPDNPPEEDDA